MTVDGAPAAKPARLVGAEEAVAVAGVAARFVSRGGEKLDAGLEAFGIEVSGRRVLDAGVSTGGFTDCCLQRGAIAVIAVDVGYGQLHERLRRDPRVELRERSNIRALASASIDPPVEVVVADLSFISLRTVAPALLGVAAPGADLLWLVKPQFEAGWQAASEDRGVIRDPSVRADALCAVGDRLLGLGATIMGAMVSPLRGADGNVEFLLHAVAPGGRRAASALDLRGLALATEP